MISARQMFWAGVRAELPLLLGVIPFGAIYGVLGLQAGMPTWLVFAMSSVVFAGSSQFIIAKMVQIASPFLTILATAVIVNVRHALYSASLAPYLRHLRSGWKWLLAYLLTDEAYAVAVRKYHDDSPNELKHWYFLGAGLTLWTSWQLSTLLGIVLGAAIPDSWSLDFTLALTFIAIVVPMLRDRAVTAAAFVGATVAVLAVGLPYKLNLMLAAVCGIGIGVILESRKRKAESRNNDQNIEHRA